jgi:hypothetical protein
LEALELTQSRFVVSAFVVVEKDVTSSGGIFYLEADVAEVRVFVNLFVRNFFVLDDLGG